MSIAAGRLRERIVIEAHNLVDNGRGGRKVPDGQEEWITFANTRAEIVPIRGGEALSEAILRESQVWRVTIRRRAGVSTEHRIRWGTIVMNINTSALSQDRGELVMTTTSGVPT